MDNTRCILKDDRILMLETTFGNQKIAIANIYAPQSVSEKKYSSTHIYTTSLKNTQMMITQSLYSETSIQYWQTTKTPYQVKNTTQGKELHWTNS